MVILDDLFDNMNTNDAENTDTRAKKMNNGESSAVRENKNTSNPVQKVTFDAKSSISKENVSDNETTNDEEDVIGDFHSDRKFIGAEKTNNRKSSRAEMIKKLPNSVNSTKFNVKPGTSKSGNIDVPENGQEKIQITSDKHVQLDNHLAQLHQQRKFEEKRLKEEEQAILERQELERQRHRM
ncbi:uncharacterized protein LOC123260323 isoform X1 [Cotesia glomerata]|uniref:uncharacterized protein LOC123260323 isoform X1 n=3 Tax=Cotesia glomerata TaxID=32391 RepID=UPI001D02A4C0|nr:uncharacterized protein LOC123260323 isoform X1 [Cotesia glomerata]